MTTITHAENAHDALFFRILKRRVRDYLRASPLPRRAGWPMYLKALLILGAFGTTYGLLIANVSDDWRVQCALIIAFHYAMFQMTIGIVHDATHGAYTGHRRIDAIITRLFDLLGIDSRHWIHTHVHAHHSTPNVPLVDSAIESFLLVRLHPKTERFWFHRYQHMYIVAIYALVTVFQIFILELLVFRNASAKRFVAALAKKLFVLGYSIVIPILVVHAPASRILIAALVGHMICGVSIAIIFQTTHLASDTRFPAPDAEGHLDVSYVRHILDTTADVAPSNALYTWIAGGLNIHVAHHLFPHVSQTHLPALAKIVEGTAREFHMPYRKYGLFDAITSHASLLAKLGVMPSAHEHAR